jgi:hypothetical protein
LAPASVLTPAPPPTVHRVIAFGGSNRPDCSEAGYAYGDAALVRRGVQIREFA